MEGQLAREKEVRMEIWRGLKEAGIVVSKSEMLEVANIREVMIRLKESMISKKVFHMESEESIMIDSKDLLSLTQSTIL
jgi:hypothetical protein